MFSNIYNNCVSAISIYCALVTSVLIISTIVFDKKVINLKTSALSGITLSLITVLLWSQIAGIPPLPSFFLKFFIIESSLKISLKLIINVIFISLLNVILVYIVYKNFILVKSLNRKKLKNSQLNKNDIITTNIILLFWSASIIIVYYNI